MTVSTTKKTKKPNKNEIARNVAMTNTGSTCNSSENVATKSTLGHESSIEMPQNARTKLVRVHLVC